MRNSRLLLLDEICTRQIFKTSPALSSPLPLFLSLTRNFSFLYLFLSFLFDFTSLALFFLLFLCLGVFVSVKVALFAGRTGVKGMGVCLV